ncbi:transposase [Draconibacterium sp.]|uniref:transposase n=1 Tax=Draconibacterium sp. TaxID=1965318 RepID=UPI0035646B05
MSLQTTRYLPLVTNEGQGGKGMEIFAWCIMPNHVHLIFRSSGSQKPELLLGDFKRFTSNAVVKALLPRESFRVVW